MKPSEKYGMQPEAIIWFKRLCRIAAVLGLIIVTIQETHKFHLVIAYDFNHLSIDNLLNLGEIIGADIVQSALFAIPYWLALLICRLRSRIAKFAFYGCAILWFMETGGAWMVMTFAIEHHFHPLWLFVLWAIFATTELLLLGLAIVVLNERYARQWLHGY